MERKKIMNETEPKSCREHKIRSLTKLDKRINVLASQFYFKDKL